MRNIQIEFVVTEWVHFLAYMKDFQANKHFLCFHVNPVNPEGRSRLVFRDQIPAFTKDVGLAEFERGGFQPLKILAHFGSAATENPKTECERLETSLEEFKTNISSFANRLHMDIQVEQKRHTEDVFALGAELEKLRKGQEGWSNTAMTQDARLGRIIDRLEHLEKGTEEQSARVVGRLGLAEMSVDSALETSERLENRLTEFQEQANGRLNTMAAYLKELEMEADKQSAKIDVLFERLAERGGKLVDQELRIRDLEGCYKIASERAGRLENALVREIDEVKADFQSEIGEVDEVHNNLYDLVLSLRGRLNAMKKELNKVRDAAKKPGPPGPPGEPCDCNCSCKTSNPEVDPDLARWWNIPAAEPLDKKLKSSKKKR